MEHKTYKEHREYKDYRENPNIPEHIRKLYSWTLMLSNKERAENLKALIKMVLK